jgi:hypothetical protein
VEELIFVGKVIGGFGAVVLIISAPWLLIDLYATKKAKRVIIGFCSENNLKIDSIEVHKNHYGLRFLKEDEKGYVRFLVGKNEELEWVGEVPVAIKQSS